jgi:RHS repeat-associated protein
MRDLNGVQVAANPVWRWTYDALGNVASEVDPANLATTYTYDMFGRVLSKTLPDPDGSGVLTAAVTEFTYDAFGNLISQLEKGSLSVEGDERITTHEYNSLNLRTRTILPDPDGTSGPANSPILSWSYDANGNLLAETNPLGRVTRYTWNMRNKLTKTDLPEVSSLSTTPIRSSSSTTYDLFGNITSTTDGLGRTTRFDHDAMGRVILTIMPHPDGVVWSGLRSFSTETNYDANGNVIRVTDHMARVSTSAYDSLNRPVRSTKPDPYSDDTETAPLETISYDIDGNVARKTDALGRITRFEYDALNRPILTAVQDGSVWAETETRYDLAGNATRIIDPLDRVTVYTFNNWNLQTRVWLPSPSSTPNTGPATSTTYDQWGNALTVTSPRGGVTHNEYDRLNRLTRQLLPLPGANMTRPETTFEYDAAGNVVLQSVLINRIGTSEVWTETETTYDELNRVIRTAVRASQVLASSAPSPTTITSTSYDKAGNVLSVTRHGETTVQNRTTWFQYDRLNRKVAEIAPAPSSTSGSPVTRYRYDLAGNLEATIDPLGRITSHTYDALGRLRTTTSPDPDGLQGPLPALMSTFRYDVVGNLLSTTDHPGRTTTSTYDSRNRVLSVTRPDADLADHFSAPVTRYTYDLVGNKIQETDALGNTTDYLYDNLKRLTTKILPDALINDRLARPMMTFTYDLAGNLTSTTDAAGRTTLAFFDMLNRKIQDRTTDPDGTGIGNSPLIMVYTYDAVGNLLTSNSYRSATVGRITRHEYDHLNRLIKTTTPPPTSSDAQLVTLYAYDIFGNQTSVTQTSTAPDAIQKTTVYVYDNLNRLTETKSPNPVTGLVANGPVSTTTYDLAGRVLTQRDPLGRVTTFYYDDLDRKIRVVGQDPDASSDATADKLASETLYAYDNAGNLLSTSVRRNVDAISSTASSADVFTTTSNFYDRLNRLTTVIDANGKATQYRYDNNSQRIQLTDASWNTSRWQYDSLGNVIAETDANSFSTVFEYDLVGNVTAVTDRRGFRTNYVRDDLNRITNEQWLRSDAGGTAFITELRNRFDHYGRPSVAEQWNLATTTPTLVSISSRIYDDLDRLLIVNNSSTPGQNFSRFTYRYDDFGNQVSRVQQTGGGTSLITVTTGYSGYDYLNRLTQVSQTATGPFANWQNKSVRLSYYDDGSTQSITRYSDATWTNIVVNTAFGLDASGRLISQVHARPNGTSTATLSSYQYKYLADGRLMNEVSAVPSLNFNNIVNNFGYDATGQLTSADRGQGADESFAYDDTGNRIVNNSIVGKGNRIQNDGNFIYTYDAEGNLTRRQRVIMAQGADTLQEYTAYSWDHRNHLTKVEFFTAAGVLLKRVEHTYDSDDNRISKKVTTFGTTTTITTENYVYDGAQLVATLNASGAIQHQYFDGTSLDQIFADQNSVSGILWPLEDRTGTARDIINTAGTVLDHRVLDSFGTVNSQSGPNVNYEQFFSGLLWDADSQLYYVRARWYEPVSGRFLSEDPLGFDAGDNNISRYSGNDPINYVDRNGLFSISHAWNKLTEAVGDAFEDVGDFFEDQWHNGNIQKGLLAAGTLASGGMLGFGLASGSLMGTQVLAGGLGFASGLSSSYEVFSGNRIGDGSFTRYLGAAAAVSGGFFAAGVRSFGTVGRTLSGASGLISGYEIASGDVIGDGTLSSLLHVSNLGINQGGTMFSPTSTNAQRFGVGLNLAVGTASVITSSDRSLQQSLRALSIASGVWNTASAVVDAKQSLSATARTIYANRQVRQTAVGAVNASSGSGGNGRRQQSIVRLASGDESDEGAVVRAYGSDNISRSRSDYSAFEEYLTANPENSPIGRRSAASIRQETDAFEGWLLTEKFGLKSLQIAGPIRIVDISRDQPPAISALSSQQLEQLKPFLPPSDLEVENRHANAVRSEAQWLAVQAARIRQERLATVSNSDDLWANLDYMEAGQVPLTANFRRSFYEADYVISSEHNQTMAQAQYAAANLMEMPIHGLSMLPGGGVAKVAVYHLSGESQDPLSAYFEVVGSLAPFGLSQLSRAGKPTSTIASFADDIRPAGAISDYALDYVDAGGKLYGTKRLGQLEKYLAKRGVTLDVASKQLLPGKAGSFVAHGDGTATLRLMPDPTAQLVWHELGHFLHWQKVGDEAYRALPRLFENNVPEQFVFDLLERGTRWDKLTPEYRLHMVDYIENTWGGVGR